MNSYRLILREEIDRGIRLSFAESDGKVEREVCSMLIGYEEAESLSGTLVKLIKDHNLREAVKYQEKVDAQANNAKEENPS